MCTRQGHFVCSKLVSYVTTASISKQLSWEVKLVKSREKKMCTPRADEEERSQTSRGVGVAVSRDQLKEVLKEMLKEFPIFRNFVAGASNAESGSSGGSSSGGGSSSSRGCSSSDDVPSIPGRLATSRLPVTNIGEVLHHGGHPMYEVSGESPRTAGLLIRAERNYEGKQWVAYDRQFRFARKDLDWSVPDPRLYNEAFTGRARAIARCSFCLQDGHVTNTCPHNPNRPMYGWSADQSLDWPCLHSQQLS